MNTLFVQNLSKSYNGVPVIEQYSQTFQASGIVFLTGPSGSGKTTFLRLVAGLERPDEGRILGGGAERCSYLFQEHRLFPHLTAIDNVAVAAPGDRKQNRERAGALLASLQMPAETFAKFPHALSGGMRQRVALARALLADRPILLLDEPFKELDEELCTRVMEILRQESERKLLLFVTHRSAFITPDAAVLSFPLRHADEKKN